MRAKCLGPVLTEWNISLPISSPFAYLLFVFYIMQKIINARLYAIDVTTPRSPRSSEMMCVVAEVEDLEADVTDRDVWLETVALAVNFTKLKVAENEVIFELPDTK